MTQCRRSRKHVKLFNSFLLKGRKKDGRKKEEKGGKRKKEREMKEIIVRASERERERERETEN